MVRFVVGGALLGGVLVLLGGVLLGTSVNVTSTSTHEQQGSGRYIVRIDESEEGKTYTIVDSETGSARLFNEDAGTVLLDAPPSETVSP